MIFKRFIDELIGDPIISDRMLLLTGPRQVGKTTTAREWLASSHHENLYFNWDDEKTRRLFRKDANFFESMAREAGLNSRIVFDEIHKISNWKTLLKGYYDTFGSDFQFLVTGSARLELFHRAGDSMLGRYHFLHLNPLIPNEVQGLRVKPNLELNINQKVIAQKPLPQDIIETLLHFSGFPEPYQKQSERSLNLWQREYKQRIIREDMRDLTKISDFNRVEHLLELLPARIGSPLSMNSLRGDLGCSYDAVKSIIMALNKLCVITLIRPYSHRVKNSISKEPKIYLTDWTQIDDEGARFENFIAIQIKTFCEFITDGGFCRLELFYLRDKQKHETDFLIVRNNIPVMLIESKVSEDSLDKNLKFFSQKFRNIKSIQVVQKPCIFKKVTPNIWILSANRFFNLLWSS